MKRWRIEPYAINKLENVKASDTRKIHMNNFPHRTLNGEASPPQTEVDVDAAEEWFAMKFVLVLL